MYSNRPPANAYPYAPNEQGAPYDTGDIADRPQFPQTFQPSPYAEPPYAQPPAQPAATANQPSLGYPQYSNTYGAPSPQPAAQKYYQSPPSEDFSLGSYLRNLNAKDKKRLYWAAAIGLVATILLILFEVYRTNFENWIKPATEWLTENDSWSWTIPTAVLIILSFPPLFGHEIVMLFVGLAYPIGVGIGIACAGAILGEAACFVGFKYLFTSYVDKKIAQSVRWATTAKVSQEAGFRGILIIRYSIIPPHLANPLFACTGMPLWLYMSTVVLSLPKTIIFVILSSPDLQNSTGAKIGKYAAITVLVIMTIYASRWIWRKSRVTMKQIEAERGISESRDERYEMLRGQISSQEALVTPHTEMAPGGRAYDDVEWNEGPGKPGGRTLA